MKNLFSPIITLSFVTVLFSLMCAGQSSSPSLSSIPVTQQKANQPQPSSALDSAFVSYFSGKWRCAGEFSNGNKIEADITFTPDLENHWLQYRHTDRPPGRFKSLAMWGIDRVTGKFISLMQDSGGGVRLFQSQGWVNNSIIFQSAPLLSPIQRQERFTYAAEPDNKFKMTYEVSPDGNSWRMGDYLICAKEQ